MKTPRSKTSRTQAPSLQELLHHYACGAVQDFLEHRVLGVRRVAAG